MPVKTIDVFIIGGGPAGLTAALRLAGAGLSVYLAEKDRIGEKPRSWITWRDEMARRGFKTAIMNKIDTLTFNGYYGGRYDFNYSQAAIVDAKKLLIILKQKAAKAGAIIGENEVFYGYKKARGRVIIRTNKHVYDAAYCVDASGRQSKIQRILSGPLPKTGSMGCYAVELSGLRIKTPRSAIIFDGALPGRDYFWLLPYSRSKALAGCFFFEELNGNTVKRAKTALSKYMKYRKLRGKTVSVIKGNIPLNGRKYFSKGRVFFCGDSASSPLPSSGYGLLRAIDEASLLAREIKKGFKTGKINYSRALALARYPGFELHYFVSDILKNINEGLLDRAIRAMNGNRPSFVDNFMRGNDLSVVFAARALRAIFSAFTPGEIAALAIRRDYREFLTRIARDYPAATPEMTGRMIRWLLKSGVRDILKGIGQFTE